VTQRRFEHRLNAEYVNHVLEAYHEYSTAAGYAERPY